MNSVAGFCVGIIAIAVPIGVVIGWLLMAIGISDTGGPLVGLIAFFSIIGVFILAIPAYSFSPKVKLGVGIMVWSMAVGLATAGLVALFS